MVSIEQFLVTNFRVQFPGRIMNRKLICLPLIGVVCVLYVVLCVAGAARADYPQPSPTPVSWELTLTHSQPKRIVVQVPGDPGPTAYWYMTYHVVNNTDQDHVLFYPTFDLVTEDGKVIRSDTNLAPAVFDAIKGTERIKFLLNEQAVGGELRQGDDQSRDGVAIWPEPDVHMGTFNIFAMGFWGEAAIVKVGDQDVTLRKTLQLTYHLSLDENAPDHGVLTEKDTQFVMR